MNETERQFIIDGEQLKALAIAYFTLGGMSALTALFSLIYVAMGAFMGFAAGQAPGGEAQAAAAIAVLFGAIGLGMFLGFGVLGTLQIWTGVSLLKGRRRILALVTAALTCLWIPFGTVLGAITFVVLLRPSVEARFRSAPDGSPASGKDGP